METLKMIFSIGIVNYLFGAPYKHPEAEIVLYSISWSVAIVSFLLILIAAYLLGSMNFAVIVSKMKYKQDIRNFGSGNAGMTNMMRTYGKKAAVLTLLGDILKTVAAVLFGYLLMGKAGAYVAGVGAVIGHTWPLYYNFKGGKGVATAITMILCTKPLLGILLLGIFIAIVAMTKYISLGSVMGAMMYPVFLANFGAVGIVEMSCSLIIVGLIVFNHRSNIKRLYKGEENKFSFKKSVEPPKEK